VKLLDNIEKYLVRAVVLGIVLLVVVQAALTQDPLRFYLSLGERVEGQKTEYPAGVIGEGELQQQVDKPDREEGVASPWAKITISLEDYSMLARARVLVNNEEVASFTGKNVELKVMAGDIVEIDSTYYNFPVSFKITAVSSNLAAPSLNQSFTSNQGIVMLGKVVVK